VVSESIISSESIPTSAGARGANLGFLELKPLSAGRRVTVSQAVPVLCPAVFIRVGPRPVRKRRGEGFFSHVARSAA
jgi:hypothetical protein